MVNIGLSTSGWRFRGGTCTYRTHSHAREEDPTKSLTETQSRKKEVDPSVDGAYSWSQDRTESKPFHGKQKKKGEESERLRSKDASEANQDSVFAAEGKGTECPNRAGKASVCESPVGTIMTANNV